jgi:hypothetical protein
VKFLNSNLSKEELNALCSLNNNPNVVILKVDKGNESVNTFDYDEKLLDLVLFSSYKYFSKNPINQITNLVAKSIKSSSLDLSLKK